MTIVVAGAGRRDRGDDGAGPAVADRLRGLALRNVEVLADDVDPMSLLEAWSEADGAIIVDAIAPRGQPGRIVRFDAGNATLPAALLATSTHGMGVAHAIELARILGKLPPRLVVFGIEAAGFGLGAGLSPLVARAVDVATDAVVEEILGTPGGSGAASGVTGHSNAVSYTYFPMVTGFVRKTLGEFKCDVILGYPQGDELVQNTNAYYRTTYALIYKPGNGLDGLDMLADPRLKEKRIGIVAGTPPASIMARNGLMVRAKPYPLMVDTRFESSTQKMIADLKSGDIDVAVLWGPFAGYYAKQSAEPLVVVPLLKENKRWHLVFRITMGVRASDQEWKRTLNKLLRDNQKEINGILLDFGVPLLDEQDHQITQ